MNRKEFKLLLALPIIPPAALALGFFIAYLFY